MYKQNSKHVCDQCKYMQKWSMSVLSYITLTFPSFRPSLFKRSLLSPTYSARSPSGVRGQLGLSLDCPRTPLGLYSDFFLAVSPAKLENPSPNLVLGQSEDSPRTARTLGLSSDGFRGLNSDCPRTVGAQNIYHDYHYTI
jgi:hypothetical protein